VKTPNRYELAHLKIWSELPQWKREAIAEDRANGKDSPLLQTFAEAVIKLAEDTKIELTAPKTSNKKLPELTSANN
jgi:hypothetical protein